MDLGRDLTGHDLGEFRRLGKDSRVTCLLHQKSIQRSAQTLGCWHSQDGFKQQTSTYMWVGLIFDCSDDVNIMHLC